MTLLPKIEVSIFEAILARRSVRRFKARKIGQESIRILLEAAVRAPTAAHQEPWGFIIIQDIDILKKLSDKAKPLFINEVKDTFAEHSTDILDTFKQADFNIFYNSGTLILICGKTEAPFYQADCWLAAENLMLAATAMGLGTCVIGSALPALFLAEMKTELNIPNGFTAVAPIVLGYPDNEIVPVTRRKPVILASIGTNS
ncbi:MAG: nitroreductase family protein [Methylophilus sp.]